ncbi:MAG TPA: MFS transporter [Gemmatimonadaceae bacterium]|nr:MFS transporter [Gemmatimonadaceae bacterium]
MGKLVVLMATAFMDMVGVLIVIPLLPFYAKELGSGGLVVGLLVSSFSVAQLLMAPVWGRFSDHYGRRPALMVGMTASAIAYIFFAFADNLWLLFLSRLVQGAGGGTVTVIQAYVADAVQPKERAKALGWLSAATNAGVAIGPLIGGAALAWGRPGPGLLASALTVVNIGFAWRFLVESRDMTEAAEHRKAKPTGRPRQAVMRVVSHPNEPASRLIWIYAIAIGAFQGSTAILALFLAERFGVTEKTIGFFFAYIGVLSVLTRALLLGPLVDRFGEAKLSRAGLVLLALGLGSLPLLYPAANPAFTYVPLALAVALIPLGTAFTFPCVTALLSRIVSSSERGLYMGVQQTFGGASRVAFPIIYGFLFDRMIGLPFYLAAVLVAATISLGLGMESYVKE